MRKIVKRKLKIGIDVDGIVANTLPHWLNWIAKKTKVVAQVEDITLWDMAKCPPLDQIDDPKKIYGILQEPYFTVECPMMFGAPEAIQELMADGHEVYFVTARSGHTHVTETYEWFHKKLPFISTKEQLIFCSNKKLIPLDVLIDDKAETLVTYKEAHPKAWTIGITYPYNIHLAGSEHKMFGGTKWLDRTLVWGQIVGYIDAITETLDADELLGDPPRCCIQE